MYIKNWRYRMLGILVLSFIRGHRNIYHCSELINIIRDEQLKMEAVYQSTHSKYYQQ